MAQHTIATALPTRLAALAALGLLLTACGNEPTEVGAPAPGSDESSPSAPDQDAPSEEGDGTEPQENEPADGSSDIELTIERSLGDEDGLTPESGFEEGVWTLTCAPESGDHPDPEAACAEIEEVGTDPFLLDTSTMTCTMQIGGPEVVRVTGHIEDTEIDTEFNKRNGCEIDRFSEVEAVINP
ncbi:SSI family serine proteinase inhibitor [Nocardiopsis lambiniae]|uniref:SSI family serine proteinase inhibitor n=1 Tax=Nocardiopsis lambiniae TaxID=3075539 RepID=A0ABU2MEI8_9ACTN|nr:SSI family serine proteinase inhibitor [Nocardiopsis sp. DSM 44743]MDT0331003.1 SSI family serine proteinase inhibitor [Nocardiopsis sp. DSM 44743]